SGPQASEGEAQRGAFCGSGRIGQGDQRLHCGYTSKVVREGKVASEPAALLAILKSPAEQPLRQRSSFQPNSLEARSGRSELAGDLPAVGPKLVRECTAY